MAAWPGWAPRFRRETGGLRPVAPWVDRTPDPHTRPVCWLGRSVSAQRANGLSGDCPDPCGRPRCGDAQVMVRLRASQAAGPGQPSLSPPGAGPVPRPGHVLGVRERRRGSTAHRRLPPAPGGRVARRQHRLPHRGQPRGRRRRHRLLHPAGGGTGITLNPPPNPPIG